MKLKNDLQIGLSDEVYIERTKKAENSVNILLDGMDKFIRTAIEKASDELVTQAKLAKIKPSEASTYVSKHINRSQYVDKVIKLNSIVNLEMDRRKVEAWQTMD